MLTMEVNNGSIIHMDHQVYTKVFCECKVFKFVLSFLRCTFLDNHNESELVGLEVSFVVVTILFGLVFAGVHNVYFVLRLEG